MSQKVLSYDLGGTKVAIGVITSEGIILESHREAILMDLGKEGVIERLLQLGDDYLTRHPDIQRIGIASAGPLDPQKGELLDPTNFISSQGERWGRVPITQIFEKRFKRPTLLENDAAAAVLAEYWRGAAQNTSNVMVLTLGTGLGTGIICNGKLVRSGRYLHPEAGHLILNFPDQAAPCGCGNSGCAEAYLSGKNFEARMRIRLNNEELTNMELALQARQGETQALAAFHEYAEILAVALHNYVRIYAPELILFSGSFAEAHDLFLDPAREYLGKLLKRLRGEIDLMPQLKLAQLGNQAGLIGGAYIALHAEA